MKQKFTYTASLMSGVDIVLHIDPEKVWHRDAVLYDRLSINLQVDVVHRGTVIAVEKLRTYRYARRGEHDTIIESVVDEYMRRVRSGSYIQRVEEQE
jgi:hypothetical protein